MKIITRLYFFTSYICAMIWCLSTHSSEQNTLTNALGDLSAQLHTLEYSLTPFPNQISLPQEICILDDTNNSEAPTQDQLRQFKHATGIELIQLVVVWQDLTLPVFCELPSTEATDFTQALEADTHILVKKIMECLLKNTENNELQQALKKKAKINDIDFSIGGGSASCGYQALAHLNTLYKASQEKKESDQQKTLRKLTNLRDINALCGFGFPNDILNSVLSVNRQVPAVGEWRKAIVSRQEIVSQNQFSGNVANEDGEWLTSEGIKHLLSNINVLKQLPYVVWYIGMHETEDEELLRLSKLCAVIINEDNYHWYGALIRQSTSTPPIISCIIVDSKNEARYNEDVLIKMLRTAYPNKTSLINANRRQLKPRVVIHEDSSPETGALLKIARVNDIPSLHKALSKYETLSTVQLRFIFNNFAAFVITKQTLKNNFQAFADLYKTLKENKMTDKNFSDHVQKKQNLSAWDAQMIALVMFPIFY